MFNPPSPEVLSRIPRIFTAQQPLQDRLIYLHLFFGGSQFFIAEISKCHEFLWGYVILDFNDDEAKWTYASLPELQALRVGILEVSNDRFWKVRPGLEVHEIRSAHPQWKRFCTSQHVALEAC